MEQMEKNSIMQQYEQIGENSNTIQSTDDFGEPWYSYDNAPINTPFNQKQLDNGMIFYHIKTETGSFYEYVKVGGPKSNFNQTVGSTGMPEEYRYKSSKDFRTDIYENSTFANEAIHKARNYIKEYKQFSYKGAGLYIYSPSTGSGKTFLACLIANGLMKTYGESIKFAKSTILFENLKREINAVNRENPLTSDRLKRFQQIPVLIIDDLGAERVTDFSNTKMYELISRRYDLNKVTIITSKKEIKELKYDTSIVAAINRSCIPIFLPAEDVATKLAQETNKDLDDLLNQG